MRFFLINSQSGQCKRERNLDATAADALNRTLREVRLPERWCDGDHLPEATDFAARVQPTERHACPHCHRPTSRPGLCIVCEWDSGPGEAA
jgi:hypothetical protein